MAEREGKGARISRIAVLVFSARPGSEELLGTIARAVPGDRELFLNDDCPVPAPERFRRAPAEELAKSLDASNFPEAQAFANNLKPFYAHKDKLDKKK